MSDSDHIYHPNSLRLIGESDSEWLARRQQIVELWAWMRMKQYRAVLLSGDPIVNADMDRLMSMQYGEENVVDGPDIPEPYPGYNERQQLHREEDLIARMAAADAATLSGDIEEILKDIDTMFITMQVNSLPADPEY